MATAIIMPKLGNSVESTIIVGWKKQVGDAVAEGEILCEVETDKAVMEVPSTTTGTLLAILQPTGAEVPVMAEIAVIGAAGEDARAWPRSGQDGAAVAVESRAATTVDARPAPAASLVSAATSPSSAVGISPRARKLAQRKELELAAVASGSGPGGRIIERDIEAALALQPKLTPVAKAMVAEGGFAAPPRGSGPGGRVTKRDLVAADQTVPTDSVGSAAAAPVLPTAAADEFDTVPVRGVRKVIADRMLASLQSTAQLTLNGSADARALQTLRARLKASDEALGLRGITINDLVLLAVARSLPHHPDLNALFTGELIQRYRSVHLGVAVDTPRGLLVPVVRHAETLSLKQLAGEAKRLAVAAQEGKVPPDQLTGGTFTVTNLGAFGVESFTPVLNPPQVAILGVSNITLRAVADETDGVAFVPHLGLSLTINHQVVDGAPAARFLQTLARNLANIDLLLAM